MTNWSSFPIRPLLALALLALTLPSFSIVFTNASPAPIVRTLDERWLTSDPKDTWLSGRGNRPRSLCKCSPGDACWPSSRSWNALNTNVEGNLIKTTPIGTPCHNPTFDQGQCDALQAAWADPLTHERHPTSMMHPLYTNNTCNPFLPQGTPCTGGFTPMYVVNAKKVEHIQAAIAFAKSFNIRLVIRNSGHDFLGRSTGFGALGVWLREMKGIEFLNNDSQARIAAGTRTDELYQAVAAKNKVVVAGGCPTVAFAGGYLGGGGHSPLTPILGIAADHVVEYEIVLANGKHVKANAYTNPDLFWALKGGGAGNFGVITHVTVNLHDDMPVSGTVLQFSAPNGDMDKFFQAVDFYRSQTPNYTDAGAFSYGLYLPSGFFRIQPFFAPRKTKAQVDTLLKPLINKLNALGIPFTSTVQEFPTYRAGFEGLIQPEAVGQQLQMGSRLIPRTVLESNPAGVSAAIRMILSSGSPVIEFSFGIKTRDQSANAVNPAWQGAQLHVITASLWSEDASFQTVKSQRQFLTNTLVGSLRAIAPNSGAHISEADVNEPDFKATFFGSKYGALQAVKQQYDPDNFFFVPAGVNSDKFTVGEIDGKLCRKS